MAGHARVRVTVAVESDTTTDSFGYEADELATTRAFGDLTLEELKTAFNEKAVDDWTRLITVRQAEAGQEFAEETVRDHIQFFDLWQPSKIIW